MTILPARVAAVVVNFTAKKVTECWADSSVNADEAIASILKALHHPFNIDFNTNHGLQIAMFQHATNWWLDKPEKQRDFIRQLLKKSTIMAGQHKHLIPDPTDWHNSKIFGEKPSGDKSVVDTVIDNVKDAIVNGVITMSQRTLKEFSETLQSLPTPAIPDPVDVALGTLKGAMKVGDVFRGVSPQAFQAASTMGTAMKTVFSRFF